MLKNSILKTCLRKIIEEAEIVDILSRYLVLQKKGSNYFACCPFHAEKTPSFCVNSNKNFFHCFSCHASGDVVEFLMRHEHMSFIESVETLANIQGISIEYETTSVEVFESGYTAAEIYGSLDVMKNFYKQGVEKTRSYLLKRGVSASTVNFYELGYAPRGYEAHSSVLNKYRPELLKEAGLINQENKLFFQDRLVFPVKNRKGSVVGFSCRRILEGDQAPKYVNSPSSSVFDKQKELYGLYEWKMVNRSPNPLLITEGCMDVVSLYEHGCKHAIATLGTSLSDHQAKVILRETDDVIICFDGDEAGKKASVNALIKFLPLLSKNKSLRFLILPNDFDPDTYIRKYGKEQFYESLKKSPDYKAFFAYLIKDLPIDKALEEAKEILSKVPASSYKLALMQDISLTYKIPLIDIKEIIERGDNRDIAWTISRQKERIDEQGFSMTEKAIFSIMRDPRACLDSLLVEQTNFLFSYSTDNTFEKILIDAIKICHDEQDISGNVIMSYLSLEYEREILSMFLQQNDESRLWVKEFTYMIDKLIKKMQKNLIIKTINDRKTQSIKKEEEILRFLFHK